MLREPSFPPLLYGEQVAPGVDPTSKAVAAAVAGIDAGAVFWALREDMLQCALVLTPEEPLAEAMAVALVAQNGLTDALGALAPPEVAVTWDWPDGLRVNGARCGAMTVESDARDPAATPDWLVIGFVTQFDPIAASLGAAEPGEAPDVTGLREEGCIELTTVDLLESWSRHFLVWLNRWRDDGFRPVYDAWIGRAERRGEAVEVLLGGETRRGVFMGLDESGGMLLKTEAGTVALPLAAMVGHPRAWPPISAVGI